jgi:hypothetical protein
MKVHYSVSMMIIILLILFILYQQSQVSGFADLVSSSSGSQDKYRFLTKELRDTLDGLNATQSRQAIRYLQVHRDDVLKQERDARETREAKAKQGSSSKP